MYTIYIRHFLPPKNWEGATNPLNPHIEYEVPMCKIPYVDGDDDDAISEPKVTAEMGKAGSFDFILQPNNNWYGSLCQMKTMMRVTYDSETIFYGRVLNVENPDMWGQRKVHCEGALAFLLDTMQEPVDTNSTEKISLAAYVKYLIDSHNSMVMDEPQKKFHLGQVPGKYTIDIPESMQAKGVDSKYRPTNWTSTMNCLEDLTSKSGGYWRVRYAMEGYIDTIGQYGLGNIDLNHRLIVYNDDGTISTERSFSINENDKEVLIPQIVGGVILSVDDAIEHYHDTGEYLGKFNTVLEANTYADELHDRQDWYYNGQGLVERLYLDWLIDMFDPVTLNQPLQLTENIISMSNTVDINGLFTVLIPEGTKNGKPLYLDYIPKTAVKRANTPTPKPPITPKEENNNNNNNNNEGA